MEGSAIYINDMSARKRMCDESSLSDSQYDQEMSKICEEIETDQALYAACEELEGSAINIEMSTSKSLAPFTSENNHKRLKLCDESSLFHSEDDQEMSKICEEMETDLSLYAACEKLEQLPHCQVGSGKSTTFRTGATPSEAVAGPSTEEVSGDLKMCNICNILVKRRYFTNHLNSKSHKLLCAVPFTSNVAVIESAFKNRIKTFRIRPKLQSDDSEKLFTSCVQFIDNIRDDILNVLNSYLKIHISVKVNFILYGSFTKPSVEGAHEYDLQSMNTVLCSEQDNLNDFLNKICSIFTTKLQEFEMKESGWSLQNLLYLDVNVNKFNPLKGSSYIDLPLDIKHKKAVVNVQNDDNECFKWAVLSALYPTTIHAERLSNYQQYADRLNMNNISYPVKLQDIKIFENQNNVSINVFGLEYDSKLKKNSVIGPLYYTKQRKETHINLLYLSKGQNGHYCFIKNLSRLVSAQINSREHKKVICDGCLLHFVSLEQLQIHNERDCVHVRVDLPSVGSEGATLKFKNDHKSMEVPFVVYADFEAFLVPLSSNNESTTAKTVNVERHDVHSFGYFIKCSFDDSLSKYRSYRGENCGKVFAETLSADVEEITSILNSNIPMSNLTNEEQKRFLEAVNCHICNQSLNGDSVRDHDHLTGKFRGAAHNKCNINYKVPKHIPVFLHNLSNYDAHFIVHELNFTDGDIEVIPLNKEKYISFTKKMYIKNCLVSLRFLDSFRFMSSSLASLVSNLNETDLIELRKQYPNAQDFNLLLRKGVYPYDFIKSHEDLEEIKALPNSEHFFNKMTDTPISLADYEHAQSVWNHFKCKNMGEYSDLYLKTDVILLTDVFESFRKMCLNTYKLDPAHYFTIPGLSWDAMLKLTKVELELLTDYEMLSFIKKGIRGGISQCSNRYAKANNKYMPTFDEKEKESFIAYLDANNLYGWAMSKPLPRGNFKWVDVDTDFHVSKSSSVGFILEVDLSYPVELHDLHSDLPFCSELTKTPLCQSNRLVTDVNNKSNYVIHYLNLIQCLEHGLKLTKVHRILQFDQSPWMKEYIDFNTALRAKAKSAFEKDFYKLMNNSVFGKTMENVEKRKNVKLVTSWDDVGKRKGANSLISRPEFHSRSVFSENLVAVQLNKTNIVYDKPIYLGFCILDISKTLMYKFHYEYMKPKYNHNVKLMYMDTDSFTYQIFTADFYEDIKPDIPKYFDTSEYNPNNKYDFPLMNKKQIGFFKDEMNGKIISEFVGLRSKMYAFKYDNDISCEGIITKAKGVNRCVTKKLVMKDYSDCLFYKKNISKEMYRFKSLKHIIFTQKICKNTLSSDDTKRFLLPNSTDTLPWGHYKIK